MVQLRNAVLFELRRFCHQGRSENRTKMISSGHTVRVIPDRIFPFDKNQENYLMNTLLNTRRGVASVRLSLRDWTLRPGRAAETRSPSLSGCFYWTHCNYQPGAAVAKPTTPAALDRCRPRRSRSDEFPFFFIFQRLRFRSRK